MSAAAGLTPGQHRAIGLTVGALYAFHAIRGVVTQLPFGAAIIPGQFFVGAMAWIPGVLSLVAFLFNRVALGRLLLLVAALTYPFVVVLWPMVSVPESSTARLEFWIHQIPGLAAAAAILTLPLPVGVVSLFVNCLLVEAAMREVGIIDDWNTTLVRSAFSVMYSGFFMILMLYMLRNIDRANQATARSSREQTEAVMMQARDSEIGRLDRLTHDLVLSLLSSAADGVPTEKLRVQSESVRRQLASALPQSNELGSMGDMLERIERRTREQGVQVHREGDPGRGTVPRGAAVEIEAAVDEAVRNMVRHAWAGRFVWLACDSHSVLVRVRDNGPGFDPDKETTRLGVTQSILHRMNTLPGGFAQIDSTPGHGTVVTISWRHR